MTLEKKESGLQKTKLVAVAVPLSNSSTFTDDEKISLRHLDRHLGRYDRFLVVPDTLQIKVNGFREMRFHSRYFGSVKAHQNLLFSEEFYQAFSSYEFLLVHHLDSLVFSDKLMEWCEAGFDYIAPPWIRHKDAPYYGNHDYEGKVGNGGFSLRKIKSFLAVLRSKRLARPPSSYIKSALRYGSSTRKYSIFLKYPLYYHHKYNGVRRELDNYPHNEDHFWADRAMHYDPNFKVVPVMTALRFAFECVPRYCFELNENRIPFGCHAWNRYDRDFWIPHLIA